jgi:nucleotide-binding universal stress UspA family protein
MRILMATDFSAYADIARSLVNSMTMPPGSRIRVVHAIEPITTVAIFASPALLKMNDAAKGYAGAMVQETVTLLAADGRDVDGVVTFGRATDVIVDECEKFQPDLLVVGSRGRGDFRSAVLGSVSAELVDRAPCPVLVARTTRLARLVLAEDGSRDAAAGAAVIADLPVLASCAVRVVSVVDAAFPIVLADPGIPGTAVEAFRSFEEALPRLRSQHETFARDRAGALSRLGIQAKPDQREGNTASQLIAAAAELHADAIIIGSRGRTGLMRLVLGSVARSVLFHAPCSVLVAHAKPILVEPEAHSAPALAASGAGRGIDRKEVQ